MQKFHIIGINNTSIKTYFFLKKLKYKATISDLSDIVSIKKKKKQLNLTTTFSLKFTLKKY